jgi:hypothetical protein
MLKLTYKYVKCVLRGKVCAISLHLFSLIIFLKFTAFIENFHMQILYSAECILELSHDDEWCWRAL